MKRLTMLAALDACGGYGQTAIAFARGIEALAGAKVSIRASSVNERWAKIPEDIRERIVSGPQPGEWELLIHHPNFVPTPGKKTAYVTMNESTRLNPLSVHLLNQAAVVIVPSEFCAVTFSASGVTAPIRVVPLGFDPKIYRWRPMPDGGGVVFGTAGSVAGGESRKGLGEVVTAFRKAFPLDKGLKVRLKIKCHPDRETDVWTDDDRIELTAEHLSDTALAEWYASLTCFVSVSKGEGFGLMPLQAMACGRPVISPKFGGVSEYFKEDRGYVMPHTLVAAPPPYCGHWCHVKETDLIAEMGMFYAFYATSGDGKSEAMAAAKFTWQSSCEKLVAVLDEFGALADAPQEFHAL